MAVDKKDQPRALHYGPPSRGCILLFENMSIRLLTEHLLQVLSCKMDASPEVLEAMGVAANIHDG